jgi:hypothetical protein
MDGISELLLATFRNVEHILAHQWRNLVHDPLFFHHFEL